MSRRRGPVFSYLAAYMLGLVCRIGDSSVAGNQLQSLCMPAFLVVLVLLVQCINRFLGPFRTFWRSHPRRGLVSGKIIPFQDILLYQKHFPFFLFNVQVFRINLDFKLVWPIQDCRILSINLISKLERKKRKKEKYLI